jgi:hypothetical protein
VGVVRHFDEFVSVQGLYLPASLASGLTAPMLTIDDSTGEVTAVEAPSGGGGSAPRIVAGRVSSAGAVLAGSGFTVSRTAYGRYVVTFSTAFDDPPVVVVSRGGGSGRITGEIAAYAEAVSGFNVVAGTSSAIDWEDTQWSFTASAV